jgi:hypothetical protein
MRKFALMVVAVSALVFTFVLLAPQSADAGWRRRAWRHEWAPGLSTSVGRPRWGYYAPRRYGCCGYPYAYYPYWRGYYWRGWH